MPLTALGVVRAPVISARDENVRRQRIPQESHQQAPHCGEDRFETLFLIDNNGREAVKCAQTDSNQAEDIWPR